MTDNTERNEPDEAASPSKADGDHTAPKITVHGAMLGIALLVAIVALVVAIAAVSGNRASQAELGGALAKLDAANAIMKASKAELGNLKAELGGLKAGMGQYKARQEESRKNQEAMNEKTVQAVSRIQAKLKISPRLDAQLQQGASAPFAAPSIVSAPAASPSVTSASPKKFSPHIQDIRKAIDKFNQKQ